MAVAAPVLEPLLRKRGEAGGAALTYDERRVVPEPDAVRREPAVRDGLPEAVAVGLLNPLEQRSLVRGVVAGELDVVARARRAACRAHSGRSTRPSRRARRPRPGSIAPPTTSCVGVQPRASSRSSPAPGSSGRSSARRSRLRPGRSRRASARARAGPGARRELGPREPLAQLVRARLRPRCTSTSTPSRCGSSASRHAASDSGGAFDPITTVTVGSLPALMTAEASSERGRRPAARPRARPPRGRPPPC